MIRVPLALACVVVLLALAAGQRPAVFAINPSTQPSASVADNAEQSQIDVLIDNKPFTTYRYGGSQLETRSIGTTTHDPLVRPFFTPLHAADGTEVTSDECVSKNDPHHPHHRSVWVGHGDINGADSWTFAGKPTPRRQVHVQFEQLSDDGFVELLDWQGTDGRPVMRERRSVKFIASADGCRAIDLEMAFTPSAGDVKWGDTKEAGLCAVRVAKGISDACTITNSAGGVGEQACWGKPARWCDLSGSINGKPFGVAVFDHPANPRHPATWHVREYGLLAANIFGLHAYDSKQPSDAGVVLQKAGQTLTFRCRVLVHPGDAHAAQLAQKYRQYVDGK